MVYESDDGLTGLDVTLFVPPGLTEEEYIMGATAWYYSNFTETGNPMKLGPIEVLSISLNGKIIYLCVYAHAHLFVYVFQQDRPGISIPPMILRSYKAMLITLWQTKSSGLF